jgi:hypothetical protein
MPDLLLLWLNWCLPPDEKNLRTSNPEVLCDICDIIDGIYLFELGCGQFGKYEFLMYTI